MPSAKNTTASSAPAAMGAAKRTANVKPYSRRQRLTAGQLPVANQVANGTIDSIPRMAAKPKKKDFICTRIV